MQTQKITASSSVIMASTSFFGVGAAIIYYLREAKNLSFLS